jgi:hypothetical protein
MDEIDASGRQMLIDRTPLSRGRLSVFRESSSSDLWFPRLLVTLKKSGTDQVLWEWTSHTCLRRRAAALRRGSHARAIFRAGITSEVSQGT